MLACMSKINEPKKGVGSKKVYSAQEREEHLHAWKSSCKSGTAYAREHGLSAKSLYSWRSAGKKPKSTHVSAQKSLKLLPVSLTEAPRPQVAVHDKATSLSMRYNGVEVYVSGLAREDISVVASEIHKEVFNV